MNGIQISRHVFNVDDTIRTNFTEGSISKLYTIDGASHTAALHTQYTTSFGYLAFIEGNVYIRCHGILVNHVIAAFAIVVEVHVIKLDRSRVFCGCHFFGLEVRLCSTGGTPEDNCIYRCGNTKFFRTFESASSREDEHYISLLFGKNCINVIALFQVGYGVSFRKVFCRFKFTVSSQLLIVIDRNFVSGGSFESCQRSLTCILLVGGDVAACLLFGRFDEEVGNVHSCSPVDGGVLAGHVAATFDNLFALRGESAILQSAPFRRLGRFGTGTQTQVIRRLLF